VLQDDSFFAYVAALDEGDDPFQDESCWPKANPSYGVTFGERYLREQVTQARGMPSKEALVRRLNFCQWTDAVSSWVDRDLWDAAESDFDPAELAGLPCYLGLDLSQKRDLTALAAVWQHPDGHLSAAVWFWTPGDTMDERGRGDSVPYRAWHEGGHLFAPPGRIIDKRHVATFVQEFVAGHNVVAMAYDQAQIEDFRLGCDDIGLETYIYDGSDTTPPGLRMVRHGQGFAGYKSDTALWMPQSVNEIEGAVMNRIISIRRNPVLRWNSASAVLTMDPSGNRKWDKQKSTGRIDGIVALAQAVGCARSPIVLGAGGGGSIFDRADLADFFSG